MSKNSVQIKEKNGRKTDKKYVQIKKREKETKLTQKRNKNHIMK